MSLFCVGGPHSLFWCRVHCRSRCSTDEVVMHPAIRVQADNDQLEFSKAAGFSCEGAVDHARQEFAAECDVNTILKRYGAAVPLRPVSHGDRDFDGDLLSAVEASRRVAEAWQGLAPAVRTAFPDWGAVVEGLRSGALVMGDSGPVVAPPVAPVVPEAAAS